MTTRYIKIQTFLTVVLLLILSTGSQARGETEPKEGYTSGWFVSAYYGTYTSQTFLRSLQIYPLKTENNHFLGLGVGKELIRWKKSCSLEVEGMFAKHYGDHADRHLNFEEYVINANLRYSLFPWDKYLKTTLAAGEGISYASKKLINEESRNLMNYLMLEATFALPSHPALAFVYRVHHRSGIFGLIATGGSNYHTLGLRYQF